MNGMTKLALFAPQSVRNSMREMMAGGIFGKPHTLYKKELANVFGPEIAKAKRKAVMKKALRFGTGVIGGAAIGTTGGHMLKNKDKRERLHGYGMYGL